MLEFSHHFRAMGTDVNLWLWHDSETAARQALLQMEQFFAEVEARLSRFKPDSELSHLNQAAGQPFVASDLLFDLVASALDWRERTNGIFDPTVLKALVAYGYDRTFEEVAKQTHQSEAATVMAVPAAGQVQLNRQQSTITLPAGVGLDLGGLAKGWTVQQAAQELGQLGPALVDAGGDIVCMGRPPTGSLWLVGVADPHRPEADLAALTLADEAVATSSLARRRWQHHGRPAHHLIDPRTGAPAQTDLLSVTVIAPRLPEAEIYAKVALILGLGSGLAYLETQSNIAALLVTDDGRQYNLGSLEDKAYVYSSNFAEKFLSLV
jgi:thiamine biosynthesis lipoprotein